MFGFGVYCLRFFTTAEERTAKVDTTASAAVAVAGDTERWPSRNDVANDDDYDRATNTDDALVDVDAHSPLGDEHAHVRREEPNASVRRSYLRAMASERQYYCYWPCYY